MIDCSFLANALLTSVKILTEKFINCCPHSHLWIPHEMVNMTLQVRTAVLMCVISSQRLNPMVSVLGFVVMKLTHCDVTV